MAFDVQQLNSLDKDGFFARVYTWKKTGLTQAHNRDIPKDLLHVDHALRFTGGGLVFHSPGDIVFSHAAPINGKWPARIKQRYQWMAETLATCLRCSGVPVELTSSCSETKQDINYCASYHTPYECMLDGDKVAGIAVKKTRSWILFQGVVHVQNTARFFAEVHESYKAYFTQGLSNYIEFDAAGFSERFLKSLS